MIGEQPFAAPHVEHRAAGLEVVEVARDHAVAGDLVEPPHELPSPRPYCSSQASLPSGASPRPVAASKARTRAASRSENGNLRPNRNL